MSIKIVPMSVIPTPTLTFEAVRNGKLLPEESIHLNGSVMYTSAKRSNLNRSYVYAIERGLI